MRIHRSRVILVLGLGLLLLAASSVFRAQAVEDFFTNRCASCHSDDTPTCNGCHQHRGTLVAAADQTEYRPGDPITVTLYGGQEHGWVRGLLYDHNNQEVDRATGPSGQGDDGLGSPVTFPVQLHATAPSTLGDLAWNAAWFGGNIQGTDHLEIRAPVTIHVVQGTGVEEGAAASRAPELSVSPNPARTHAVLRLEPSVSDEIVRLEILDASGRCVRHLWHGTPGAGPRQVIWDTTDDGGRSVASGVYWAILRRGDAAERRALQVLR
jgi:hypothetical protein